MLRRTYRTIDGGEVTVLRPETALDRAILEFEQDDPDTRLDAEHSFGDTLAPDDTEGDAAP